jgi:hypothetical protein
MCWLSMVSCHYLCLVLEFVDDDGLGMHARAVSLHYLGDEYSILQQDQTLNRKEPISQILFSLVERRSHRIVLVPDV